MNLSGITYNLPHKALDVFVSGCNPPYCFECHNPVTWDFKYGKPIDIDKILTRVVNDDLIHRVRLMGGEPLDQDFEELKFLINSLKTTKKEMWLFTKYMPIEIPKSTLDFLYDTVNYIKHGRYVKGLKPITQHGIILASDNQYVHKIERYVLSKAA